MRYALLVSLLGLMSLAGCEPVSVEMEDDGPSMRTVWPDGGDIPADEWIPRGLRRTESGYYSWVQPGSAVGGWEGRCGQTAMANIAWHCGYILSPDDATRYVPDLTPGVRPGRLASGLNDFVGGACGEFRVCRPDIDAGAQPLRWLQDKVHAYGRGYPTPVLISQRDALHWVVVMEIREPEDGSCTVVYLEDGRETHRSCGLFVQTWALDFNLSGLLTRDTILGRYTAICRRER